MANKISDEVIKAYQHCLDSYDDSTTISEDNIRYVINKPYSDAEIANAAKYDKPLLKFNILVPALITLVGNEQQFKRKGIVKADDRNTTEIVGIIQGRWNKINDEQNIEEKIQTALFEALMSKRGGWIQRDIRMNDDGYLDYFYESANGFRIFPDPEYMANDYMMKNLPYLVKEAWIPTEETIEKYDLSEKALEMIKKELEVSWYEKLQRTVRRITDRDYSKRLTNIYDKENDQCLVLELWKRKQVKVHRCFDQDGDYFEYTPKEFEEAKEDNPSLTIIDDSTKTVMHLTTIIPYFDDVVALDEDLDQPQPQYDVFNVLSYAFPVQLNENPCLIELLKDIQDNINKGESQARDYMTQLLGGGFFIDKREEEAIKLMSEEASKPNLMVPLKNPKDPPKRFAPGSIAAEVLLIPNNSLQFAERITLINSSIRGESERSGESARLFERKLDRSAAAINPYYKNTSNLRYALLADFVDSVGDTYSDIDRPIPIKTNSGEVDTAMINVEIMGEVLNDVRNVSMYVELDEGEQNITVKEENFEKLLAMFNLIIQANPAVAARLVKVLVEQAPIKDVDKLIAVLDDELLRQRATNEEAQELDTAKQILENQALSNQNNQPATT